MRPVLELNDLRTEFHMRTANVVAVDGVSLSVAEGESLGIVGESGCGKTTIGLSIMRLLPGNGHVSGGNVVLNGRDIAALDEREMRRVRGNEVALIPQDPMTSLNPTMRIGKQIAEAVRLHRGASKQEARDRTLEVLRLVDMPRPVERLNQYAHELSGGLRQRVMIAMALACDPKLLIADEPTTALDVTIQAQILDLIDDLRERLRMSVILITHDMGVIAGRTDRVVVMYGGKMAEESETETLFARMRHPYTDALLASVPKVDQNRADRLLSIPGLPPDLSKVHANCRFNPRCPYATDQCREEEPPLTTTSDPGMSAVPHRFACFHPVNVEHRPMTIEVRSSPEEAAAFLARRAADLEGVPELLGVDQLVKEFPVMQRRRPAPYAGGGQRGDATSPSPSRRVRCTGWSESLVAERRRSAGSWWRSSVRTPGRSGSRAERCRAFGGANSVDCAATCSSCSKTPTRRSTPGCGSGRSCENRSRCNGSAPPPSSASGSSN